MITNNQNVIDILQKETLDHDVPFIEFVGSSESLRAKSITLTSEGSLYTANATMLEVVLAGSYPDKQRSKLTFTREIMHPDVDNGNLQTIDYGTFVILECEVNVSENTTKLVCYDLMVQTQQRYDHEAIGAFPMSVKSLIQRISIVCGIELDANTYPNEDYIITMDEWANLSYTYRDVLDHLAQLTARTIGIKQDKLSVFDVVDTGLMISGNFVNLSFSEKYGKTNILNISQEPQHDNHYYPLDAHTIPVEDRKELVFENNPILFRNVDTWLPIIFNLVKDVEYTTATWNQFQGGILQVGDMVKLLNNETGLYEDVVITKQIYKTDNVVASLESSLPFAYKNEYVVETDQQRAGQTVYFVVDKQNGIIEGLVGRVDDNSEQIATQQIAIDGIKQEVSSIPRANIIPDINSIASIITEEVPFHSGISVPPFIANGTTITPVPKEVFDEGYTRNYLRNSELVDQPAGIGYKAVLMSQVMPAGTYTMSVESIEQVLNTNEMTEAIFLFFNHGTQVAQVGRTFMLNELKPVVTTVSGAFDRVWVYSGNSGNNSTPNNFIFHKLKLEKGNNPNPEWTPAWEDLPLEEKTAVWAYSDSLDTNKLVLPIDEQRQILRKGKYKNISQNIPRVFSFQETEQEIKLLPTNEITYDNSITTFDENGDKFVAIGTQAPTDILSLYIDDFELLERMDVNVPNTLWTFQQSGLRTLFQTLAQTRLINSPMWRIEKSTQTDSGYLKRFLYKGIAQSSKGFIVPDSVYSYRAYRLNSAPYQVNVLEYRKDETLIKETLFNLDGTKAIETFTFQPDEETVWASIQYIIDELPIITDEMFTRGEPTRYRVDNTDYVARSRIEQMADKIVLRVDAQGNIVEVKLGANIEDGSFFKVKADQIVLEGFTTINGNTQIDENGDLHAVNAFISGIIQAVSGNIGNMILQNSVMTYITDDIMYRYDTSDMSALQTLLRNPSLQPTDYQMYLYDMNRDGTLDVVDMAMLQYTLNGNPPPIQPIFKNKVEVGTLQGHVSVQIIYDGDKLGPVSTLSADHSNLTTLNVDGLSLQGRSVEPDTNGFLKLV